MLASCGVVYQVYYVKAEDAQSGGPFCLVPQVSPPARLGIGPALVSRPLN